MNGAGDAAKATIPIGASALLMAYPVVIPNQKSMPYFSAGYGLVICGR
jgi:hypothetical protein